MPITLNEAPSNIAQFLTATYEQLLTLKSLSLLTPGFYYQISDRFNYQAGGTGVIPNQYLLGDDRGIVYIQALTTSEFNKEAIRIMAVPSTYAIATSYKGVWNANNTFLADDIVIWGAKYWSNLTGSTGSSLTDGTLDSTNWSLINKTNEEYVDKQFSVLYDFDNDWFESQTDNNNNKIGVSFQYRGMISHNACDITDWNYSNDISFYNNSSLHGIFNNISTNITNNNITQQNISNNIADDISDNNCTSIRNNISSLISENQTSDIMDNIVDVIYGNYNIDGTISENVVDFIYLNSNNGSIDSNTGNTINNNKNDGSIFLNEVLTSISSNSNIGSISYNITPNSIENNTSALNTIISISGANSRVVKNFFYNSASGNYFEIDITGLSEVNLTTIQNYAKNILLTSSNATETITAVSNAGTILPNILINVMSGLSVRFTNSSTLRCKGNPIDINIVGTNKDWVEFLAKDPGVQEINSANY
jgi:hypothetical protein